MSNTENGTRTLPDGTKLTWRFSRELDVGVVNFFNAERIACGEFGSNVDEARTLLWDIITSKRGSRQGCTTN